MRHVEVLRLDRTGEVEFPGFRISVPVMVSGLTLIKFFSSELKRNTTKLAVDGC